MGGKCISFCLSDHSFSNFSCWLAFNNIASAMNRKHYIFLKTKCCNFIFFKSNFFFLHMYRDMLARKYPLCLANGGCDTISQTSAYALWCKIILSTRQKQSLQPCRFKDESYFLLCELCLHLLWCSELEPDLGLRKLMPTACEASAHQKYVVVLNWTAHVSKYCQAEHPNAEIQRANWEETADVRFRAYKMDFLSTGEVLDSVISGPAVYQI